DCGRLRPDEALCLHTDGAEDARDARGRFFCLREALTAAVRGCPTAVPQVVLGTVFSQLLRHGGTTPTHAIAPLVLRHARRPRRARARTSPQEPAAVKSPVSPAR